MTQIIAITAMIALTAVLAAVSAIEPAWLNDNGNPFLRDFVDNDLLSFLGVVVTITLASAANMHLQFNRIEIATGEAFSEARRAVKAYAILLLWLFAASFALVIIKPLLGSGCHSNAGFNSAAIMIVLLNILALADLTLAIFRIGPISDQKKSGQE